MTTISEDIQRNREQWGFVNYPVGYKGRPVTEKYVDTYGGYFQLIVEQLIKPYIHPDSIVLEIGPGNGKWTQFLTKAKEVICVDLREDLEKVLRERFPDMNLRFFTLKNNITLNFLGDCRIDYIFAFDIFMHLGPESIQAYLAEFYRVLKFNGHGVIHYHDWKKWKAFRGEMPPLTTFPENDLTQMKSHMENSGLVLITPDTELLSRDRILTFTKKEIKCNSIKLN